MERARLLTLLQAPLAAAALVRLAQGRVLRPPLSGEGVAAPAGTVSVVIPARDEERRLGTCLDGLRDDGDVAEVVVVDDRSTDATAALARAAGARVVAGRELPGGWVGKTWALQQGLEAAAGDWVVFLDADTRPRTGLARALVAVLEEGEDLVSAGARFICRTPGEQLLHPSLLATLAYRFGPLGRPEPPPPDAVVVNGQCIAVRREALLDAGGFGRARGNMTDDIALARSLARDGWRIAFVDGGALLSVRMFASAAETWREWGRSLALVDVTPPARLALDLATVWLVLALPMLRLAGRRMGPLDRLLLAVRVALLPALAGSYVDRGFAFWLSPLADPASALRLTLSAVRPPRTWRGRTYGRRGTATR